MSDDQIDFNWNTLPETEEGVPYLEFGGVTYYLPYLDLVPQTVSAESLRQSIVEEGIEYPIIVDQENNVIDGMTRLFLAHKLGLSADEVPMKRQEVDQEEGWVKAIELNAVRRQISPDIRRHLIQEIVERKNWRKPSIHVSELASLLGVHKSTISRDLDRLYGREKTQELKKRRSQLNISLTGMRNVGRLMENDEILKEYEADKKVAFGELLEELIGAIEEERSELSKSIDGPEDN